MPNLIEHRRRALPGRRLALAGLAAVALAGAPAHAQLNCNPGVEFHADGGLSACSLNGEHALHTAAGLPVRCADGERAELGPHGRLQACTLARDTEIDGHACVAGSRVEFTPDGALARCTGR